MQGLLFRADGGDVAYRDLREFVKALEKAGELKRVRAEVDPVLEITEVVQRVQRGGGLRAPGTAGEGGAPPRETDPGVVKSQRLRRPPLGHKHRHVVRTM